MFLQNYINLEERALGLYERRSIILASNIANSNTPNYKAKDIDFHEALKMQKTNSVHTETRLGHIELNATQGAPREYYRVPAQHTLDGNTVDEETERKNFMQNAIRHQAALAFIQSKSTSLLKAIKGE